MQISAWQRVIGISYLLLRCRFNFTVCTTQPADYLASGMQLATMTNLVSSSEAPLG